MKITGNALYPSPTQNPSRSPTMSPTTKKYRNYNPAPQALYQPWMNVSFASGKRLFYQEAAGTGNTGSYNGVLGIAYDRTEQFAYITSPVGKKLRKLRLSDTYVELDISSK